MSTHTWGNYSSQHHTNGPVLSAYQGTKKEARGGGVGGGKRVCFAASSDVTKTAVRRFENGTHTHT